MKVKLGAIGVLTLALVLAVAFNVSPYLRGPESWRWAYAIPGQPWRHLVPATIVGGYGLLLLATWRRLAQSKADGHPGGLMPFLCLTALAVPLIQAALLFPESPDVLQPLFYRTISAGASGSFSVSTQIENLRTFLIDYPALMPTFPVHPQRYPPGLLILFYAARTALAQAPRLANLIGGTLRYYQCHDLALMRLPNTTLASARLQMALPVLCGLIVFPLYGLTKETIGRSAALLAVGLYPLVPSFALWSARWDQLYPLLTCTSAYLFYVGLTRKRTTVLAAAGVVLGLTTFFSFGMVAMLMPLGLIALFWAIPHRERRAWGWLVLGATAFTAGLIAPWAIYQGLIGHGFLEIWHVSMSYHLGLDRGYWVWLGYHLYDFLLFLGIPIAGLLMIGIVQSVRRIDADQAVLPLGFGLSLLLLNLIGVARGEVARVWLFLTPFPVAIAAGVLGPELEEQTHFGHAIVLGLLCLQLLVFNAHLRVVTTGVTSPPERQQHFAAPEPQYPLNAEFSAEIALLGYDLVPHTLRAGETLTLTLYWQALSPIPHSYTVFNHVISPEGMLIAQQDGLPQQGYAPTTCWVPGEVLSDSYQLAIPLQSNAGTYALHTGLYRWDTGERVPVDSRVATTERAVRLTELTLP